MALRSAITIDVDSLRHYRAIHGLTPVPLHDDPIYRVAMHRFWGLIEGLDLSATVFAIGEDAAEHPEAFAAVMRTGSEIASHSHRHDYRLTRQSEQVIADDLACADAALRPLNGGKPIVGFRAPGYNVSPALLQAILQLGYRYDSSLLPSPLYWAARWSVINGYGLLGRESASLGGAAHQFAGPLKPYRTTVETPWSPDPAGPLIEMPMACEPTTRTPLIGTSWVVTPEVVRNTMLDRTLRKLDCVVFEMHAIDLLDTTDDPSLAELAEHQRDLHVPAMKKASAFQQLFHRLKDETEVCTLATLSQAVA